MLLAVTIIGAVVLVVGIIAWAARRRRLDGVDTFRRQIDALSPEARRPTIDKIKPHDDEPEDDRSDDDADR